MEQFTDIELKFNRKFMYFILEILKLQNCQQVKDAYDHWFRVFQQEPMCTDACEKFFAALDQKALIARDPLLLKQLPQIFDVNIDISELVDKMTLASQNLLWTELSALYRLAVIICIYVKMPLIQKIVEIVLSENSGFTRSEEVVSNILQQFAQNTTLRSLINELFQQDEGDFMDVFGKLALVLEVIQAEQRKPKDVFSECCTNHGITDHVDELFTAVVDKNEEYLDTAVELKWVTPEQVELLTTLQLPDDNQNLVRMTGTLEAMRTAMSSGEDADMNELLRVSGLEGVDLESRFKDLTTSAEVISSTYP